MKAPLVSRREDGVFLLVRVGRKLRIICLPARDRGSATRPFTTGRTAAGISIEGLALTPAAFPSNDFILDIDHAAGGIRATLVSSLAVA